MVVSIGSRRGKDRDDGDVVDALLECHGRIRDMLAIAARLGAADAPGAEDVRTAAARVRRYFVEALPRHVADEEEDLQPRLVGRDPAVDAALATMHADHAEHERDLGRFLELCATLEQDPARHGELAAALAGAAATVASRLAPHLELEEQVIFPAVRALPAAEREAISAAMRARRT